jgi:DNA-binding transcriptional MerR regulator
MHKSRATRLRRTAQVSTRCQASATPVGEANSGLPLPQKPYFKLGEVVRLVGAPAHVLRYWEKEIPGLRPSKTGTTQQRRYRRADVLLLCELHRLLYKEKYTLAGAKRQLAAAWAGEPTALYSAPVAELGSAVLLHADPQSAQGESCDRATPSHSPAATACIAPRDDAAASHHGGSTDPAKLTDGAASAVQAAPISSEVLRTELLRSQALQHLRRLAEDLVEAAQLSPE